MHEVNDRSTSAMINELVDHLELDAHPEGGWYRRIWTAPRSGTSERSGGSSILYLMAEGAPSRWHRIDAVELWQHSAGAPVELEIWAEDDPVVQASTLGPLVLEGHSAQVAIAAGRWQRARSTGGWSLAVCVVVPEFRFEGFELASPGWSPTS